MQSTMTKPISFVKSALLKIRLDQVVDKLGLTCEQWARLCRIMLPEEFAPPRRKPKPTNTLPGPSRIEVYQKRVEKNEDIFDFLDGRIQNKK